MSRSCKDCSEDGMCARQDMGLVACSDGKEKSIDQKWYDLDCELDGLTNQIKRIRGEYKILFDKSKTKKDDSPEIEIMYADRKPYVIVIIKDGEEPCTLPVLLDSIPAMLDRGLTMNYIRDLFGLKEL